MSLAEDLPAGRAGFDALAELFPHPVNLPKAVLDLDKTLAAATWIRVAPSIGVTIVLLEAVKNRPELCQDEQGCRLSLSQFLDRIWPEPITLAEIEDVQGGT